jgi:hypothetical protein
MTRVPGFVFLLFCLPCAAATVYKSVDAQGRVSYSDQAPVDSAVVDILEFDETTPTLAAEDAARLAEMRETTDRMAADRREREASRSRVQEERVTTQFVEVQQEPYYYPYYSPVYSRGYSRGYSHSYGRRRHHPIIRPPSHRPLPVGQSRIRSQYPASLIRQHYTSTAARVFNPRPSPGPLVIKRRF